MSQACYEVKTKTTDGAYCWYEMILTNLYDDKKRPLRAVGTLHNITAQKEAALQIGKELGFWDAMLKDTIRELYKKADLALYHAKRRGKDGYCFYYPGLSD